MPARNVRVRQLGEMEELVEEFLIRLPADEPGHLLRASLVCKPWRRLLSGQAFRRRYGEFHRTPPMLGFLPRTPMNFVPSPGYFEYGLGFNHQYSEEECLGFRRTPKACAEFVPTTDFLARGPDVKHQYSVEDCRHGRVLSYHDKDDNQPIYVVWDPMTGGQIELRRPEMSGKSTWQASVLCAADSCSHGNCHSGPFIVVFVTLDDQELVARASAYSSETNSWSSPALTTVPPFEDGIGLDNSPSVVAGGAVYFLIRRDQGDNDDNEDSILKYDLGKACLSEILVSEQEVERTSNNPILMVDEDGWGSHT